MKNKALITAGLILFFSAALVIKNWRCSSVPELEGWHEPADAIEIKGGNFSLSMVKKDGTWLINEQGYPGDIELIDAIERKARDFKILDLVSDKGYYDKYELTDEKGVSVVIKGKGKMLRKILIGKAGTTNNHSYLKVDDRKEIYLASGIMKSDFVRQAGDLRNKVIVNAKKQDIKEFSINYGGKNYTFLPDASKTGNAGKENKADSSQKTGSAWICREYEKVRLDDSSVNAILQIFSPLKAAEFPETADIKKTGNALCRVSISYADKKIELVIYSNKEKNMNYATSSESKYIFTLGSWQTEKLFIKNITDLAAK